MEALATAPHPSERKVAAPSPSGSRRIAVSIALTSRISIRDPQGNPIALKTRRKTKKSGSGLLGMLTFHHTDLGNDLFHPREGLGDTVATVSRWDSRRRYAKTVFFMSQTPHGGFVYRPRRPTLVLRPLVIKAFLIWPDGERRCPLSRGVPDARESSPRFRAVKGITALAGICLQQLRQDKRPRGCDQGQSQEAVSSRPAFRLPSGGHPL